MRSLVTLPVCLLLAACSGEAPTGYFPLEKGLNWDYQVASRTPYRSEEARMRITNLGEQEIDGEVYHVRRTSNGSHYYLQRRKDGIVRAAKRTVVERHPHFDGGERFVIREPIQPGTTWSYQMRPYLLERPFPTTRQIKRMIDYEMQWEIVDTDNTVEVPAGRFENCLHIRGRALIQVPRTLSVAKDTVAFSTDEWYAPNVGLVRIDHRELVDSNQAYGGSITLQLDRIFRR